MSYAGLGISVSDEHCEDRCVIGIFSDIHGTHLFHDGGVVIKANKTHLQVFNFCPCCGQKLEIITDHFEDKIIFKRDC